MAPAFARDDREVVEICFSIGEPRPRDSSDEKFVHFREDATDRGLVDTEHANGRSFVRVTPLVSHFLTQKKRSRMLSHDARQNTFASFSPSTAVHNHSF
jgi:hypothetical protein